MTHPSYESLKMLLRSWSLLPGTLCQEEVALSRSRSVLLALSGEKNKKQKSIIFLPDQDCDPCIRGGTNASNIKNGSPERLQANADLVRTLQTAFDVLRLGL